MITKAKRKSRLIKKFTKGAIRLSTANGSNIRKNKKIYLKELSIVCVKLKFIKI